ncbi:MAG TPA: glycosyltransferase, partial [Chthoniobacterales bacterium]|nr:glycosyltransferase [Chthoniobacterales bacterium]
PSADAVREIAALGEVYFAAGSIEAARDLQAGWNTGTCPAAVVPLGLADFLRALPICPAVIYFTSGGGDLSGLEAVLEFGAVGTQIAGAGVPSGEDFRRLDEDFSEMVRVNGRRPAGLDEGPFSQLKELLSVVVTDVKISTDETLRSVGRVLTEACGETLRRQGNLRAWPYGEGCPPLPPTMPDGRPWPKVSVITASFQQGRAIEENILSVLRQNYPNIEHIICDGGSRDETVSILRRYDAHLASWVSEKDRGQSHAINNGFAKATGEIVTWLNSDDMFAPGALAAGVVALAATGADMVAGIAEIQTNGRTEARHLTSCGDGPLPLAELLNLDDCWLRGQFFYQPEVLFTKDLWDRAGSCVREDLHYSMDYELWLRMARAGGRLTVIGAPIALFRKHDEQKTFLTESYEPELRGVAAAFAQECGIVVPPPSQIAETRRLKIVFFNDNGFRFGAGIGHRRLVEALQMGGHHVSCLGAKDVVRGVDPLPPVQLADILLAGDPDVVFFGNLHGANLGPEVLALVAQRCPVIFFMHDYWLITGRCAYMEGCDQYLEGCDENCTCRDKYPPLAPEKIRDAWEQKKLLHFGDTPVRIATNSRAVAGVVDAYLTKQGAASRTAVVNLPLPVDVLLPMDRATCRRALGIPLDAFLVLFSAGRLDDPRKGIDLLLEAIELSGIPNLHLGCLGREEGAANFPHRNIHFFGYVGDPAAQARIYSAADVYVGPSRDETFGQVFTEAAACGTPSIGFNVGGVPEAVIDGWTGIVVSEISAQALAAALVEVATNSARAGSFSALGPSLVRGRFAPEKTLNQLHRLLGEVVAQRGKRLARKFLLPVIKPAAPSVTRIHQGFVRYLAGFDRFDTVTRSGKSLKCCWVYGPKAEFDLTMDRGGRYHLVLHYNCPLKEQTISIRTASRFLGEFPL